MEWDGVFWLYQVYSKFVGRFEHYKKKKDGRGRRKLTWAEGIRGMIGEKGLTEEDWNDRSNWRKKII